MVHEDYEIGNGTYALTNLNDLDSVVPYGSQVTRPHWAFQDFAGVKDLDDGTTRGVGLPTAQWRWDTITDDERNTLRVFCPGTSAPVYIATYTNDSVDNVLYFSAVMHWPADKGEDVRATTRSDFVISFTNLIPYTP